MTDNMIVLIFFLLVGFQCILASPDPLVSSSGMMALSRPLENSEPREDQHSVNENSKANQDMLRDKREMGIIPDAEPGEALRLVKKSVPPDAFSLFPLSNQQPDPTAYATTMDMQSDPMEWGRLPQAHIPNPQMESKSNPILWASQGDGQDSSEGAGNVIYSEQRKHTLHPYATDPKSVVTIPTLIITPSTTQSPYARKSVNTLAVPEQVEGKPIIMDSGLRENDTSSHGSLIEGGEAPTNDSSDIVINAPKFVFVDENHLHSEDIFDDLETPTRIARKSRNDTSNGTGAGTTEIPKPDNSTLIDEAETTEQSITGKIGPPWQDDEIVGKLVEDIMIDPTEVSFRVAAKLCKKIAKLKGPSTNEPKRYYLWAPINQYLPLLRKAFPIRPPLFAPECLKWVLRQCRGTIRLPLLKPCTYWAPMPIRRPECGFNPNLESMIVNYRLPEHVPGNCPCVWPCTKRFDPIQRCRITINETNHQFDQIHSDGDPWTDNEIIIQDNLAAQLCRAMKLSLTIEHTVPIGWIPLRADIVPNREVTGTEDSSTPASSRRRREIGNKSNKAKREQVYVKPETQASDSSEEGNGKDQDDHFTLMGTYNLDRQVSQNGTDNTTTIRKCNVWKYKSCPRSAESTDELEFGEMNNAGRRKRSIPQYMSRLALAFGLKDDSESLLDKRRSVRQSQLDDDDAIFEKVSECGEWIRSESYRCIPEEHIQVIVKTEVSSSEEGDNEEKLEMAATNQKKKVMKDLCPGSVGKFPCFLRKKRSAEDDQNESQLETDEENDDNMQIPTKKQEKRNAGDDAPHADEAETPTLSTTYIINKIQIRPDSSCMCDWPCLPFFDRVNKCYDGRGNLLLDDLGRPKIAARSFRKAQRDPVVCINFVEVDEIYCKIKE